ncbi:MAG: hypothetical protein QF797_06405 [Alphaproteobacteria bacterium]|jgi:hypothetical protein|nr:hypothetical protein [Rhodospirillaceae bacterium]MDP6404820.1 hypothetical protein [Alphaproteobacteria bacterium]MDP6624807.1 hypothetical protein [Alphaproteobacteria bacterium]
MNRRVLLSALMLAVALPAAAQTVRQAHNDARLIGTWKTTQEIDAACSRFSGDGSFEITRPPDQHVYRLQGSWQLARSFKRGCRPQRDAPRHFTVDVTGRCAVADSHLTCEAHFQGAVTILRAKRSLWTIGRNSLDLAETTPEGFTVSSNAKRWSTNVRGEVASLPLPPPPGGTKTDPPGNQETLSVPAHRLFAAWLERYAAAHHWLLTALDGLAGMDHNSAALFDRSLTADAAKRERRDGDQALTWILEAHAAARPAAATTGEAALDAAAGRGLDNLRQLEAEVRQAATDSVVLFQGVLAGQATVTEVAIRLRQGQRARLRAELAFWRLRVAGLPAAHPQRHLLDSASAASAALIDLYDAVLGRLGAAGQDAAAVVASARRQLAAGHRAVAEGRTTTNQALEVVQVSSTLGNDARRQLFLGLAIYAQSFDVEDQVLEALAAAIDNLAAGRPLGQDLEAIATLTAQRRHHARRRLVIIRRLAGYER